MRASSASAPVWPPKPVPAAGAQQAQGLQIMCQHAIWSIGNPHTSNMLMLTNILNWPQHLKIHGLWSIPGFFAKILAQFTGACKGLLLEGVDATATFGAVVVVV